MKKIIIAAVAVVFTTGILTLPNTKTTSVQPTYATMQKGVFDCKKELASSD